MPRPRPSLTEKEALIVSRIPATNEAVQLWRLILRHRVDAKDARHQFALALLKVNRALVTKGCKGLFTR